MQHNNNCTLERHSIKSSLNLFTIIWKCLKWLTNSPGAENFYFVVEMTLLAAKLPPENDFICLRKCHTLARHWSTAQKRLQSAKFVVTWLSPSPSTNRECAGLLFIVIFSLYNHPPQCFQYAAMEVHCCKWPISLWNILSPLFFTLSLTFAYRTLVQF